MLGFRIRSDGGGNRRPSSFLVLVVLCAMVLTIGAVLFLWQRYQYIRLGFEISALRRDKTRLEERIEPLEVEAAYLSRPERIEKLARDRLGLRPPQPEQMIQINPQPGDHR